VQLPEALEQVAAVEAADQEMMVQFQHLVVLELRDRVLQAAKVVVLTVQTAAHFGQVVIHGQVAAAVARVAQAPIQLLMHKAVAAVTAYNLISAEHLPTTVAAAADVTV
jgi:hypothetical protein